MDINHGISSIPSWSLELHRQTDELDPLSQAESLA